MSYHLEYVEKPGRFDEVVEQDGVKVFIDSKALFSIIGSEMDWQEDRMRYVHSPGFSLERKLSYAVVVPSLFLITRMWWMRVDVESRSTLLHDILVIRVRIDPRPSSSILTASTLDSTSLLITDSSMYRMYR
jgi:hypothetical protein